MLFLKSFIEHTTIAIIVLVIFFTCARASNASVSNTEILNNEFINLSSDIYKSIRLNNKDKDIKSINISILYNRIKELNEKDEYYTAIIYIQKYKKLIKENIDHESIYYFLSILLKHNEWKTAADFLEYIQREGDKSLISNVKYIFAKYHFSRSQWPQTLNMLSGIETDLGVNEGHYALIMNGVTLQKLKKHREALKYYLKVPKSSKYFPYAQLNQAIAYIRQGWWTDAHLLINQVLKDNEKHNINSQELINRLYLVLGYSFLQQEYFREARSSFRHIKRSSALVNRALLGISLAAANQGDNVGALNILNLLQEHKTKALTTDESYLLLPYIYERIGQQKTAAASYTIALKYYRQRINEINTILKNITAPRSQHFVRNKDFITVSGESIHLSNNKVISLENNLHELENLKKHKQGNNTTSKINELINKHTKEIAILIANEYKLKLKYIKSYFNQAQYGIARLYDNSRQDK